MISKIRKFRFWHKWLGILSAVFLFNLGITGFILDHREWGWLYHDAIPTHYFNHTFVANAMNRSMGTIKYSDPNNRAYLLDGNQRGLWWSDDYGDHWHSADFHGRTTMPMVTALVSGIQGKVNPIYIATNDGIWFSHDKGQTFINFALKHTFVNALTYDVTTGGLIGVIDRTYAFGYDIKHSILKYIALSPPKNSEVPKNVSMSRFIFDLHFGRGLFSGMGSWLCSDMAGIAMGLLALTGLMFWLLPKYYQKKASQGQRISKKVKENTYRWLWRIHAPIIGLLAFIPMIYLSLTGILVDHARELQPWMKSIHISRAYLPPVYDFDSLKGEVYSIGSYINGSKYLVIGTRYGIFESDDKGKTLKYNHNVHTFALRITRDGNQLMIKGMGGPDYIKTDKKEWMERKKEIDGESNALTLKTVSWFDIIDGLHTGSIIAPWWKWLNDIFAITALVLVVTGLIRWWRKKWL